MSTRLLCHISLSKHPASLFFFKYSHNMLFVSLQNLPHGPPMSAHSDPPAQSAQKALSLVGGRGDSAAYASGGGVHPPSLLLQAQLTHSHRSDSSLTSCKQNTGRGAGGAVRENIFGVQEFAKCKEAGFFLLFLCLFMSCILCNSNMLKCFKINE